MNELLPDATAADPTDLEPPASPSLLDRLLAGSEEEPPPAETADMLRLGALALSGWIVYGAISGLFQGGQQVWVGALKAPCIVLLALVLCLPSLVVGTTLAGASWRPRTLLHAVVSFAAALGIGLASLLPIAWLFAVSSRRLTTVVVFHAVAWIVATALGRRTLERVVPAGARRGLGAWTALVFFVSLQAATALQPVLFRMPDQPLFDRERELFLDQLRQTTRIELDADGNLLVRPR